MWKLLVFKRLCVVEEVKNVAKLHQGHDGRVPEREKKKENIYAI